MESTKSYILKIIFIVLTFILPAELVISLTRPSRNSLRRFVSRRIRTKNVVHFSKSENATNVHNYFMGLAIEEANEAGRRGEVPIGAVIVKQQEEDRNNYHIVSRGFNMVETRHDASAHAEMLALRRAAKQIQNWRLLNMTLYCTLEPCPICLSAIQAFRIQTLVYGARQLRYGAVESHMKMLDDYKHPSHTIEEVVPGVMKEECAEILKSFFRTRRIRQSTRPRSNYNTTRNPTLTRLTRLLRWRKE
mmetsp:Transcript_13543/g.15171  ORF Transcript_13543/g.15171 Transcript_13543/m.15171 type:complete len:248 (+) Transcript_13543:62-805(+)